LGRNLLKKHLSNEVLAKWPEDKHGIQKDTWGYCFEQTNKFFMAAEEEVDMLQFPENT